MNMSDIRNQILRISYPGETGRLNGPAPTLWRRLFRKTCEWLTLLE